MPPVLPDEAAAWRKLRIRPTRLGLGLAVMVALLWLVGLNYQANLAYVAAFWLLGFIIIGTMQNVNQLLGLRLVWLMPAEIFVGVPTVLTLQTEGKLRRRWLWVKADNQDSWQEWRVSDSRSSVELPLEAHLRGYVRLPEWRIASTAPFGICTVEAVWQGQSDKVAFPAPVAHDAPYAFHADEICEACAVFARSSDDLSHLQLHTDGTSWQHIAWKAYAKTGQMLDKRFEAQDQGSSHIISYRDYPQGAGVDALAGWLCFRVLEAERSGARYELELPNQNIVPQKGQREMSLTALALW
ncbi:DUF58 domain-containing protein [Neisseria iguanae]|nr:DUF58 domain-containing protein [Neisseria iguanae]